MVLAVRVPIKKSNDLIKKFASMNLLIRGVSAKKDENDKNFLLIPVKEEFKSDFDFVDTDFVVNSNSVLTLKKSLESKIPKSVLEKVKTAYDTVGDIAILEIDDFLKEYEKLIGETLLSINSKLKTVLAKDDKHNGVFRTQKMRFLAGVDTHIANHKENGIILKVDVEEVYFSARLATERKRIAGLVKPGEDVLVMFSGCGPYTCVISKNSEAKSVVGVEINPVGHKLSEENIKKNKLLNAKCFCGDVNDVLPILKKKGLSFDRILMPLPKSAETFLDSALLVAKPSATIHFYAFLHVDEFEKAKVWIKEAVEKKGLNHKIISLTKCGQQAPYVFRICIDFKLI